MIEKCSSDSIQRPQDGTNVQNRTDRYIYDQLLGYINNNNIIIYCIFNFINRRESKIEKCSRDSIQRPQDGANVLKAEEMMPGC